MKVVFDFPEVQDFLAVHLDDVKAIIKNDETIEFVLSDDNVLCISAEETICYDLSW